MPIRHTVDREKQRVFMQATGPITLAEGLTFLDSQAEEGAWFYTALQDLRAIDWRPSASDLQQYSERLDILNAEYGPRGAVATVVTGRGALFGILRMHYIPREGSMDVFITIEEATAFLDEVSPKLAPAVLKSKV